MESGGGQSSKTECQRARLIEAITSGRLYQTKIILEKTLNVNYLDSQGLSPLMRALMIEDEKHRTRTAMVKLLLQHRADVNFRDKHGRHALSLACEMNKLDLVKILFERCLQDIDLASRDNLGNCALMFSVMNNNVDIVRLIVNAMAKFSLSVDQRNLEDKTPYYKAVEMGFDDCARVLSDVGKASQSIEVNPFLDFLGMEKSEFRNRGRISSAPLSKETIKRGVIAGGRRVVTRRKNPNRQGDINQTNISGKKRGSRLLRSRKRVHSEVSYKTTNNIENCRKDISKLEKGQIWKTEEVKKVGASYCAKTNRAPLCAKRNYIDGNGTGVKDEDFKRSPQIRTPSECKGQQFLELILDTPTSGTESGLRSRSPMSCVSTNPASRAMSPANSTPEHHKRVAQYFKNFFDSQSGLKDSAGLVSYVLPRRSNTADTDSKSTKSDANYYEYLEWKTSLDYSPNSLRTLLALRAEQQSEGSSYRKGHALPRYDPETVEVVDCRSAGVTTPSERSRKSDAARKFSAATKSVGISMYLSNKRKARQTKDDAETSRTTLLC